MDKIEAIEERCIKETLNRMSDFYIASFPALSEKKIEKHLRACTALLVNGLLEATYIETTGEINETAVKYDVSLV